jgi:hypothetical protein
LEMKNSMKASTIDKIRQKEECHQSITTQNNYYIQIALKKTK